MPNLYRDKYKCIKLSCLVLCADVYSSEMFAQDIYIAVRANKGKQAALKKWQATADLLTQKIPGYRFKLIPFENNSALNQAISQGKYHFCLTNPASSVEHQIRYKSKPLATLDNKRHGKGYSVFGSVIFTRANRKDINQLKDLKGKVFMGADELGFGGWRVAWRELLLNKIDPYKDFKTLRFAGGQQQKVVYAVRDGKADAGSVRTDMLEQLARDKKIELPNFKVLGAKITKGFPFLHSTQLYPEWLFSAVGEQDAYLKKKVAVVLLSMTKFDQAAIAGRYIGWTTPLDYSSVNALLKELNVGPYHEMANLSFERLLEQYGTTILVASILIIFLTSILIYLVVLNRKIAATKSILEDEVVTRERAENILSSLAQQSLAYSRDDSFFENCLVNLAQLFKSKYAFIGLYSNKEKAKITTFSVWADNRFIDNFEYDLEGTPCQDVLDLKAEMIESDAIGRYPDDEMLAQMEIESYCGCPLVSPDGKMIGLISVMDTRPMKFDKGTDAILKIFANRIALEMQRKSEDDEFRDMANQLSYQASHDVLTGLFNRREFENRLGSALETAQKNNEQHALCYFDLDQFKVVNDTCGHMAGDELLKHLAIKLETVARGSDTVARVGGDEFGILLFDCPMEYAQERAQKLLDIIRGFRFVWEETVFEIGASIGLVPINSSSRDIYELLRTADSACYVAKEQGRNQVHVYVEGDAKIASHQSEIAWLAEINRALNENDFVLHEQEILSLNATGSMQIHYELLLRMKNKQGEVLLPSSFINAAERYNLMTTVDRWVIENGFKYIAQKGLSSKQVLYAINLSALTICNEDIIVFIDEVSKIYNLDPKLVCFEITETAAISNYSQAIRFIDSMKRKGFRFSLDDFGTGLCSYAYLRSLPVDYLKIDGRFIKGLFDDPMNRVIVESIVQIARVVRAQTIAEWVEEEGIMSELATMKVDFAQGYHIGVPERVMLQSETGLAN